MEGDDDDDEEVEADGEQAVDEDERALGVLVKEEVLQDGWDGESDDEKEEMPAEGDGPDGEQDDDGADEAEGVEAEAGGFGVGVKDDGAEEEEEEQGESSGEGDLGEALFEGGQACLRVLVGLKG